MDDRSQYLSLAQLSQSVIESILSYLEREDWNALRATLSDIVGPLESLSSPRNSASSRPEKSAFASYEYLSTLSEAWDKSECQDVVRSLKRLLKTGEGPEAKQEAKKLIGSFQKVSTQALWNFEQPEVGLPRGVLELCKAL